MKLIISSKIKLYNDTYYYALGSEYINENDEYCLNDVKRLHEIAQSIQSEYISYIYELNKYFLEFDLILPNNLSIFFLTEVSNKRTEFSDTFLNICHTLLIKEQIERCEITSISIDKLDSSFVDMLFSCLEGIDISVINRYYKPSISNNLATFLLKQIIFAVRFIFSWSLFLGFKTKKNKSKYESIYHSIYPLLWSNCKEIKYGLSFRKQAFLLSLLSDGMHQGLSLKNFIQAFKAIKKSESTKNLILDSYLKLRDLKSLVYWSYNLRKKFKLIYIKFPPFKSIDIRKSIFDQLLISSIRIPRLITISKAYSRVVLNHNFTNFHYHLFEYSYGRMLTAIFEKIPQKQT